MNLLDLIFIKAYAASADYTPLAPIPQLLNSSGGVDIATYIPNAVKLIIAIAGGLAVIRIIVGGIQYMSTDAFMGKTEARGTIQNAILGLLLAIGAYTILYNLNPELLDIKVLQPLPEDLQGGALNPTSTSGGIAHTQKTASETGCPNCEVIDAGLYTVTPSACSNEPCFAIKAINTVLGNIKPLLNDPASTALPYMSWQIIRAFPPREATSTDPACLKPNNSDTGKCVYISLTTNSTSNIKRLLDVLDKQSGFTKEYRVTSSARAQNLNSALSSGTANPKYFNLIKYRPSDLNQYEYLFISF